MKNYFSIITLILLFSLSSLYADSELIKMLEVSAKKGQELINNPNKSNDEVLESFKEALKVLDKINDTGKVIQSQVRKAIGDMYSSSQQLAASANSKRLEYEWKALVIRLARYLMTQQVEVNLLESMYLLNSEFIENSSSEDSERLPSTIQSVIDYYDRLINTISSPFFQIPQRYDVTRLIEKLQDDRRSYYEKYLAQGGHIPGGTNEDEYSIFWDIAENYLLKVANKKTHYGIHIYLSLRLKIIVDELSSQPSKQRLYRTKMAKMYIEAGKKGDLNKFKKLYLLGHGIRFASNTNYTITESDLTALTQVFKSLAKRAIPLTEEKKDALPLFTLFFHITYKIKDYKELVKELMENQKYLFSQKAKAFLPTLYRTLFNVVDQLPQGYFLAKDKSDPALDVWQNRQENQLEAALIEANQKNDYATFLVEYKKVLTYAAKNLDPKIHFTTYKELLIPWQKEENQFPSFSITNTDSFLKELENIIEARTREEREAIYIVAMKNLYTFLVDQLNENFPDYHHYRVMATLFQGDILSFISNHDEIESAWLPMKQVASNSNNRSGGINHSTTGPVLPKNHNRNTETLSNSNNRDNNQTNPSSSQLPQKIILLGLLLLLLGGSSLLYKLYYQYNDSKKNKVDRVVAAMEKAKLY